MIQVNYSGRLGNHLFQYVFSRLVAEKFGYQLVSDLPQNPIIRSSPLPKGKIFNTSPVIIGEGLGPGYHFPESLGEFTYIVDGYFQNIDYYREKRELIKGFFSYSCPTQINFDDIVIHVRLRDYKIFGIGGSVIDPQYYVEALEREKFRKIYVVTDEPGDKEYFRFLQGYEYEFFAGSATVSFYFLMSFDRIVIGNSSFSWWAAFLGNYSRIYTFKPWLKYCSHINRLWDIENVVPLSGGFRHYINGMMLVDS